MSGRLVGGRLVLKVPETTPTDRPTRVGFPERKDRPVPAAPLCSAPAIMGRSRRVLRCDPEWTAGGSL